MKSLLLLIIVIEQVEDSPTENLTPSSLKKKLGQFQIIKFFWILFQIQV